MVNFGPKGGGGGEGHFLGKVIGNVHRIFRVQYSDSDIFRVSLKVLCRNEILVFLGSAHFPCRVKMRSFQKIFSKICI